MDLRGCRTDLTVVVASVGCFVHCPNKLGTSFKPTVGCFLGKEKNRSLGPSTNYHHDCRRSCREVLRAVVSKESSTAVRKQLADVLNQEALKFVGYLHGHRSLFHAGDGFDTASATLFRKLDTASAFPTVRNAPHFFHHLNTFFLLGGRIEYHTYFVAGYRSCDSHR